MDSQTKKRVRVFLIVFAVFIAAVYFFVPIYDMIEIISVIISCIIMSALLEAAIFFRTIKKKDKLKSIVFSWHLKILYGFFVAMATFSVLAIPDFLTMGIGGVWVLYEVLLLAIAYILSRGTYIGEEYIFIKGKAVLLSDIKESEKEIVSSFVPSQDYIKYSVIVNSGKKYKFIVQETFFLQDIKASLEKKILII